MIAESTDVYNLHCCFGFGRLGAVNLVRGQNWSRRSCLSCGNYAGIIFWRDFAIFSHFFARNRIKIPGVRKKIARWIFSHFAPLSSYFAHAVHFETIGLFCLTGFWIIVAPKFITHTNAGNHSLICIIEKLYRKNSLSVSGLSKRLFDRYLESAKTCPPTRKKKKENYPTRSRPFGMATC